MGRDKYPTGGMEAEKLSGIKVKKTDTETELELEKKKNLTGLQKINNVNFSGSKWKRAEKKKKKTPERHVRNHERPIKSRTQMATRGYEAR